ncbi:MAG: hypothetical protein HFJ09_13180 [Lachnospiraceae bacterium]|nr:hypothetical protein [Lachnospiraceae bacterium]
MRRRSISILTAILLAFTILIPVTSDSIKVNATIVSDSDKSLSTDGYGTGDLELTDEEMQWLEENQIEEKDNSYDSSRAIYPASVDNSSSKYFPSIGNQGTIGSCTSWAMVYYQMTYMVNRALDRSANVSSHVMSPKWSYNLTNNGNNQGTSFVDVLKVLSSIGAADLQQVPMTDYLQDSTFLTSWHATEKIWRNAQQYKISGYSLIPTPSGNTPITSPNDSDLNEIKKYLAEGEILSYSTYFDRWNFEKIEANSEVPANNAYLNQWIASRCDKNASLGGHRMTIVGYNDNIWVDINKDGKVQEGEKGAFKIANSWGNWRNGNSGFTWISYDALNKVSCVNNATLNNSNRVIPFRNIIRYIVKKPQELSHLYAKVTLNSAARDTVRVSISETTANGTKKQWSTIPFYGENGKKCSFDGMDLKHDGTFLFDLSNVDSQVSASDLENNVWEITIQDTKNDADSLMIKQVQLIDDKNNVVYYGDLTDCCTTINGESKVISFNKHTGNTTTIYYKGYENPNIHYKVGNGEWTVVPGVSMDATNEQQGYCYKKVIDLGDETVVTACFNDGKGNWDSKNGANYQFGVGVYGYSDGCVQTISGEDYTNYITTIYYEGFSNPFIHYSIGNGAWTNPPGIAMNSSAEKSGFSYKKVIELGKATTLKACFNDGNGNWDNNYGNDYTFGYGSYTFKNGIIEKISK